MHLSTTLAPTRSAVSAAAFALVLFAPAVSAADDADDAFARARAAEARGDLAAAVDALTPSLLAYPQDYQLALAVAELESRRGRREAAIVAYRAAIARSPRAEGARAGLVHELAWAGRCDEAETELRAIVPPPGAAAEAARNAVATCGLASPSPVTIGLAFNHLEFPSHPYKSAGNGATAAVDLARGGWSFGLTGRYLSISSRDTTAMASFTQQEGYARAGFGTAKLGASLLFAVLRDGSGKLGTSEHVGTALRWSPAGDLVLTATVSAYTDETVLRISPSYRIPILPKVSLTPAVALQRAEGATWWNGSLTLAYDARRLSLFAGGKYGEEVRPANLSESVVYNMTEHVTWGVWAGARVRLGDDLALRLAYSLDHLEGSSGTTPVSSNLHAFTIGPVITF
jgi:tetratricopeptide (TPR) repeat protein